MIYLIVFISQVVFNVLKVLEIKYTYENRITKLLINSVFINLVSFIGFYYSIDTLINNKNYFVIVFYVIGSVVGKYIGMVYENPKEFISKFFFKK